MNATTPLDLTPSDAQVMAVSILFAGIVLCMVLIEIGVSLLLLWRRSR